MDRNFKEALKHRRTYYSINDKSPVADSVIKEILEFVLMNVPSAFNSQTTRMVLLLGEENKKLWDIVKETLRQIVSAEAFGKTAEKIDNSFACGYGTVLFFEDHSIVENLQTAFPAYKDNFPGWSVQTSGMHQLAVWVMLEDVGLGASLQHYNPLIDMEVRKIWSIPESWHLVSEMPFGTPTAKPGSKESDPLEKRVKVYRS